MNGVEPVEDDNLGAGFGGAFQTVHHGPNKCVDAGPHILKINQQHVDVAEPLGFWLPGLAVERIDPEPGGPVDGVSGLNHVVLLFTKETVLGRKEAAELTGKGAHDAKKIIVSLIGIVLVLNILWTLKQNDTSSETPSLKEELAKLEQRIVELEKRAAPDVESLRADFEAIRQMGAGYKARLKELLKAEEEHLAMMKAELEAREAWLDSLRKAASDKK